MIGAIDIVYHERFALPFACLAFALIGLPLGIANRRGGKASGFSLSIGITIAYWLLYSFGQNLVREGRLSPYIGMWAANALLVCLGLVLLFLRERSEGLDLGLLLPHRALASLRAMIARVRPSNRQQTKERSDSATAADGEHPHLDNRRSWIIVALLLAALAGAASIYLTPLLLVGTLIIAILLLAGSTLDRHVLGRFLSVLAGCVVSFFSLYVVYQFINLLDDLVSRNQPASLGIAYVAYRVPWIFAQILPMSSLMACLLTFGIMSRFNEITAVKASGTSIYRLAMPVLLATLAISCIAYVNYDYIVPYTERKAAQVNDTIRGRSARSYQSGEQRWVFGSGGRLYNFSNYVPPPIPVIPAAGSGTFQGFSVYALDLVKFDLTGRIYARSASFEAGHWVLRDGWSREFHADGESFEQFAEKRFDFPEPPGFFVTEWKTPEQMTFSELSRFVADLRRRGYDAQELLVDLYGKTSLPLVPLTLVIIGLPFCFKMGRRGSLYGVGIAILLAAIYFMAFSATSALGGTGLMPPLLAAWAPNILFIGAGTYLLLHSPT